MYMQKKGDQMHKINDYVVYKRDVCKVNDITTSKYSG